MPDPREARHEHRLSMLTSSLMTRPARYDVAPSDTTPFSTGGVQFELRTLLPASSARAFLTASHPAILARNASVNSVKLIRPNLPHRVAAIKSIPQIFHTRVRRHRDSFRR